MNFTHRPLAVADAPAINGIYAAAERAEPADVHFDLEEVVEELNFPTLDLERESVAILDGDRLIGWGSLNIRPLGQAWRCDLEGQVDPEYRRRGFGAEIVSGLEALARVRHSEQAPHLPGELRLWIYDGRLSQAELARACGYDLWRYYFDMRLELTAAPAEQPSETEFGGRLVIEPWTAGIDEEVRLASNAAWADYWGSAPLNTERWLANFAGASGFCPEFGRVARLDGQVVSFVLVEEFKAESEQNGFRTGYISRVGTIRQARRQGLASLLLSQVNSALRDGGFARAELSVDSKSPTEAGRVYQQAGFTAIRRNALAGRHI